MQVRMLSFKKMRSKIYISKGMFCNPHLNSLYSGGSLENIYIQSASKRTTECFIYYRKYLLQITQPSQPRCTQLQYRFAVISEAPSTFISVIFMFKKFQFTRCKRQHRRKNYREYSFLLLEFTNYLSFDIWLPLLRPKQALKW